MSGHNKFKNGTPLGSDALGVPSSPQAQTPEQCWAVKLGLKPHEKPVSMVEVLGTEGPDGRKGIWL